MQLTGKQKNYLRGLAHNINPIITKNQTPCRW